MKYCLYYDHYLYIFLRVIVTASVASRKFHNCLDQAKKFSIFHKISLGIPILMTSRFPHPSRHEDDVTFPPEG